MFITGTDEVGRGCIAGPIVAASYGLYIKDLIDLKNQLEKFHNSEVKSLQKKRIQRTINLLEHDINLNQHCTTNKYLKAIKPNYKLETLQFVYDSKKISEKNRIQVTTELITHKNYGLGVVSNKQIDAKGLQNANINAMKTSLVNLQYCNSTATVLHIFDHLDPLQINSKNKISRGVNKGDQNSFVIAAASIIAKTYRDYIMKEYAKNFPLYNFEANVGYGTKQHLDSINKLGPCSIHRKSYSIFSNN